MSESDRPFAERTPTSADLRADVFLAAAMLVGGVLSTWLTSVAGFYGDEQAPLAWGVVYTVIVTAPLALRRRFPSLVASQSWCAPRTSSP
ncbi:hypothetical protein [Microbacterium sp.]|jgi:hypothetical protein|uniref:hypothetical protein n=1 Tax=Microbacterium sp. TaxID=51671 RepID=UPI0037CC92A5